MHAVDPFRSEYIAAIFQQWPRELAAHVSFHPRDSVQFFDELRRGDIRPALTLVDGNHDYEFAAFDIESAARALVPGGFIIVDNVALPGPFFAVRDFLARTPGFIECGGATAGYDHSKAYDQSRTRIPNTDFIVLRSPRARHIGSRPWSPGQHRTSQGTINGIRLALADASGPGTLHLQIVLRGFGAQPAEVSATASLRLNHARDTVTVAFPSPLALEGAFTHFTVEPFLIWNGEKPLQLAQPPQTI